MLEKIHLKIILKRERMCRRDYRINLPHLIRYVTQKDQKMKRPFIKGVVIGLETLKTNF